MKINTDFVSKSNTYAGQNSPKYIVIHETDNFSKGADAGRHAQAQAAGHLSTSVHYYAGSDGIYQTADHRDGTFSVGREYGGEHSVQDATNRNTINIEICVNEDGDYTTARENAIELVKHLIQTAGIPAERVIRHFDAKGKYCPRKMMDKPELWEDFKRQIGQASVQQEHTRPDQVPEDKEKVEWYRVGTGWKNGICQKQTGAYHNREFAIADCQPGQKVYDESGKVIYSAGKVEATGICPIYTQKDFIKDVQNATGSKVDGVAGDETIRNTVTISAAKNHRHSVVVPLQKRLNILQYNCGVVDGIAGPKFTAAVNAYQKNVLRYKNLDGEITAQKKMWKSLLGML